MLDFTTTMYEELCKNIVKTNYSIYTVAEYIRKKPTNAIILRHDVDRIPSTALTLAKIEHKYSLKSTYYFRYIRPVFNKSIIREIFDLGHEIGFHYETLSKTSGDHSRATDLFRTELEEMRKVVPVNTASMHGRPLSKWNNLDLWKYCSPDEFNLLGEAYLGIDYSKVHYYSDTGRTWHGSKYNLRDKVETASAQIELETTMQLIKLVYEHRYDSLCLLTHPNRWAGSKIGWSMSFLTDFIINQIKRVLLKVRD